MSDGLSRRRFAAVHDVESVTQPTEKPPRRLKKRTVLGLCAAALVLGASAGYAIAALPGAGVTRVATLLPIPGAKPTGPSGFDPAVKVTADVYPEFMGFQTTIYRGVGFVCLHLNTHMAVEDYPDCVGPEQGEFPALLDRTLVNGELQPRFSGTIPEPGDVVSTLRLEVAGQELRIFRSPDRLVTGD